MRKTILLCLIAALAALPVAAEEMSLEQLLAKHFEAQGGADNLKAVKSARFSGKMSMGPGGEAPFVMTFARPQRARLEFTMQGMTGVQAFDGETAWMIMPFMGKTDAEVMAEDQAKNMKEQADFDGPLMDWKEKGHQVELVGLEDVEGTQAYKLKVTMANGDLRYHYLDSDYFVTIKQEGKTKVQGTEMEFETTLSDYKEVGGLMFAHSIESKPKGQPTGQVITIEKIELDVDAPDDLFAMPEPSEKTEEEAAE